MFKMNFRSVIGGLGTALILMLSGCGGSAEVDGSNGSASTSGLTISGTPATSITEGLTYAFFPTSASGSGDTLTYSVTNMPSWASFDATTGALGGTPGMVDIGITSGIVISVSNGQENATLNSFDLQVVAAASGAATLSWTAPTENADGSPLTDLDGYRVYYGTTAGAYPNWITISNPGVTSNIVENLSSGTWYFVVTAFNQVGIESDNSNVVSRTIPPT